VTAPHPRRWIGRWIAIIGLIHFVLGFFIYQEAWAQIAGRGIVASVRDYDRSATAFWFAAFAPPTMIIGGLVDHFEKLGDQLPSWLGWGMAALVVALIVPMPMTGAWLLVPPTLALLVRSRRRPPLSR